MDTNTTKQTGELTGSRSLSERIDRLNAAQLRRSLIALDKQGLVSPSKRQMRQRLKTLCGEPL